MIIDLHTHSDAGPSLGEKSLCLKSKEYPILGKPRIPLHSRIGTSHWGLSNFGSEAAKNTPPQELELLMEDILTSGLRQLRIPPPRIGTSHGGLSNYGSEAAKNTPPPRIGMSHGGLSNFGFEAAKNTPPSIGTSHGGLSNYGSEAAKNTPLQDWNFSWRT